jgi:hypothetical protein
VGTLPRQLSSSSRRRSSCEGSGHILYRHNCAISHAMGVVEKLEDATSFDRR